MASLQPVDPSLRIPTIELAAGRTVLGRTTDADVALMHPSLSRRHLAIDVRGDVIEASDLGSKNGSWVNGRRIAEPVPLAEGDLIRLGRVELRFVAGAPARPLVAQTIDLGRLGADATTFQSMVGVSDAEMRLGVLLRVSEALAEPLPVAQLLQRVLEIGAAVLMADRLSILLEEEGELRLAATRGPRGTGLSPDSRPYSREVVSLAYEAQQAMRFDDVRSDARLSTSESVVVQDIRSVMVAPLTHHGTRLGVMYVDSRTLSRPFASTDLELLVAFANQAAVAIAYGRSRAALEAQAVLQSRLIRFFPPATAQRLMQTGATDLRAAEHQVTLLFSDICGFTRLSAELSPLEVHDLLNRYFPPMAAVVMEHGGTLEKYIGDALLAVWGAPFARPDDAEQAVAAALEMQGRLAGINAELSEAGLRPLEVAIGVHSGPVAFGRIGSGDYVQYATTGDVTNTAARISDVAEGNQVLISDQTRALLPPDRFALVPQPPAVVKGKAEPLVLFEVSRP